MDIKMTNNCGEILSKLGSACTKALESCGLTAEGYAKLDCPVDTGNLRNSISHKVTDDGRTCSVGTNSEYGPYVELGTGIYYSGGRRTPWVYKDGRGNWHMTRGQRAQTYLKPAVADHGDTYKGIIEKELKNG